MTTEATPPGSTPSPATPAPNPSSTPAPASSPADDQSGAAQTPEGDVVSSFDFDGFNKDFDKEESEPLEPSAPPTGEKPAAPAPVQQPPVQPAAPAAPAAPQTPSPGQQPAAQPAAPPAQGDGKTPAPTPAEPTPPVQQTPAAPTPAQPAAQPQQLTPEQQREQYNQWRSNLETKLTDAYKLSQEDAERMVTEPDKVLPKLVARWHTDVYEAILHDVYSRLPQVVGTIVNYHNQRQGAESQFYDKFPKLRGKEKTVDVLGKAIREAEPNLTVNELVEKVGKAAMTVLGLQPDPPPQKPAAPARPNGQGEIISREVITPGGFQPAPTGGVAPAPPPQQKGLWDQLAEEFNQEDQSP